MRLVRERLRAEASPERALLLLGAPAALCGDWFASRAVIAPTLGAPTRASDFALPVPIVRDPVPGAIGGGWFGYFSYDLTDPSRRRGPLPVERWAWADHVLRLDEHGTWWFEALVGDDQPAPADLAAKYDAVLCGRVVRRGWTPSTLRRAHADDHRTAVKNCVQAIEAGELFQANVCTRFSGPFDGEPRELFAEGVRRWHPRRAAYLGGDWGALVSLSPELFLSRQGRNVRSTPIKGTLPRRGSGDDHLAARLRESTKDVAENVMITDLVRNDLGRVCEVGTVRVPELLAVRPAPGVWHLHSTVEGRLAAGVTDADLLRATFPPGSVTGAPKIRALDEIAELEPVARGVYTGAIGLVSPVAGLELNVAIRTLEVHGGAVSLGVGGGITADSDCEAEWQECLHKAATLEELLANPPVSGTDRE